MHANLRSQRRQLTPLAPPSPTSAVTSLGRSLSPGLTPSLVRVWEGEEEPRMGGIEKKRGGEKQEEKKAGTRDVSFIDSVLFPFLPPPKKEKQRRKKAMASSSLLRSAGGALRRWIPRRLFPSTSYRVWFGRRQSGYEQAFAEETI
uniref:Uncharacterized protein n=1 Tax=Oryza nivara TaxID=4536 RepID=A0A0E0IIZ2_ORYNI